MDRNPKLDACDYCVECEYFLDWKCLGCEPCLEFVPKKDSKYKKVELLVSDEKSELWHYKEKKL